MPSDTETTVEVTQRRITVVGASSNSLQESTRPQIFGSRNICRNTQSCSSGPGQRHGLGSATKPEYWNSMRNAEILRSSPDVGQEENNDQNQSTEPSDGNPQVSMSPQLPVTPEKAIAFLDDKSRCGLYDSQWLKCIRPDEKLVSVPKLYNDLFTKWIINDVRKKDTEHYLRARRGGRTGIQAIAVSKIEQPNIVTGVFVGVWTEEREEGYFRSLLQQCEPGPWQGQKIEVKYIVRPNSGPESSSDDDVPRRSLKRRIKKRFKRPPGRAWLSVNTLAGMEWESTDLEEFRRLDIGLHGGQRLYAFRDGQPKFSVTLGGFVSVSGLPFIVTSGHLLETTFDSDDEDSNTSESDDGYSILGSDSDSEHKGDLCSESLDQLIRSRESRLVFRLDKDPKSPIVGIECLNLFAEKYLSKKAEFADDWSLIVPSPEVRLSGYGLSESENRVSAAAADICGLLNEDDIIVGDKIKVLGSKCGINNGVVSSVTVALDMPGGSGISPAWKLALRRPVEYGESGSWIVDSDSRVVGQLTAGIFGEPAAYFIPITRILDGIREQLPGIDVSIWNGRDTISHWQADNSIFTKAYTTNQYRLSCNDFRVQSNPKDLAATLTASQEIVESPILGPFPHASRPIPELLFIYHYCATCKQIKALPVAEEDQDWAIKYNEAGIICELICSDCDLNPVICFHIPKKFDEECFKPGRPGNYVCLCKKKYLKPSTLERCVQKHIRPFICCYCEPMKNLEESGHARIDDTIKHIIRVHTGPAELVSGVHFRILNPEETEERAKEWYKRNID